MARRPRDAEATRLQILDAAEALFVERGFGSTSLAMISRLSNAHKSLILHHFDSKEGLWQAVKERRFSSFTDEQRELFQRGDVGRREIEQTTRAYFRLLKEDPVLVRLLARAQLEKDLGCSQYDEARLEPFVERLREAQRAGVLRADLPPSHLLLIIINVITQWFEARTMFGTWSELESGRMDEEFLDSFLSVFFDGARARPATGDSG